MNLGPHIDSLRRDLIASAAPGGPEVRGAAELLAGALDASARLTMLELLADAAAEITAQFGSATVEVRLRGRDPELVITELALVEEREPPAAPAPESGHVSRITLRLPEPLKDQAERAASGEGISVNAWLVRAVAAALRGPDSLGRRPTGYARS
ncbi:toxin-antitoxin system HicB family antitoxin [Rugosimonospora acidiphila]|uniref:Toxin-antitoxin system HicB family antitoxin n=1 Tax=Rugosimonospora acidiphila TaxID=556531 RepID=A0ABP9RPF6_9ACTN